MGGKRRKKYASGEGHKYLSRKDALEKLQLALPTFRRLCILKGIYPREPNNRKKAQKGKGGIKTLYARKDIQFLMQEKIIMTFREFKTFAKKIGRAKARGDWDVMQRYKNNYPHLTLDHIVKERFPSFIDAIRDLDDCLTLLFLFSTFPSLEHVPRHLSALCRRLSMEFLHAVIASQALRKVFISIKGYYFQADIKGQTVTWIMPHHFSFVPKTTHEVDFRIMSHFVEFYTVMLGFVNFRLYHLLNLHYPPSLAESSAAATELTLVDEEVFVAERVAAMNVPLLRSGPAPSVEDDEEIDQFPTDADTTKLEEIKQEAEKIKRLKKLFVGLKFFINREVPREPLVLMIRCFGGEVSWDKLLFVGATFDEHDESITHQIVDRPIMEKQFISRNYIQPQWVFDSVNARELLPVEKYFLGAVLPPHLSPFVDKSRQRYIPPEEKELNDPSLAEQMLGDEGEEEEEEGNDETINVSEEESEEIEEEDFEGNTETADAEALRQKKKKAMSVKVGAVAQEDPADKKREKYQEHKLREKMVNNKYRKLYRSMMEGRRKRGKEDWLLEKKRKKIDAEEKAKKKEAKNRTKLAALGEASFN